MPVADKRSSTHPKPADICRFRVSLCSEKKRLATFKSWIYSDKYPCNKKKLAEAGFYFLHDDAVCCFYCQKTLDCWEPDDDPWLEHIKHAPYCDFANLQKPQEAQTMAEFIQLKDKVLFNIMNCRLETENVPVARTLEKFENQLKKRRKRK